MIYNVFKDTPKKKYKIKREDSAEKKTKRIEKENPNELSMSETIDDVVRQSQNAMLSPHKRSPHQLSVPKGEVRARFDGISKTSERSDL